MMAYSLAILVTVLHWSFFLEKGEPWERIKSNPLLKTLFQNYQEMALWLRPGLWREPPNVFFFFFVFFGKLDEAAAWRWETQTSYILTLKNDSPWFCLRCFLLLFLIAFLKGFLGSESSANPSIRVTWHFFWSIRPSPSPNTGPRRMPSSRCMALIMRSTWRHGLLPAKPFDCFCYLKQWAAIRIVVTCPW